MKGKAMTMEKIVLEACQFEEWTDSDLTVGLRSWERDFPTFIESTDNRTPACVRVRLTEWLEGAPFFPAIRLRSESEQPPKTSNRKLPESNHKNHMKLIHQLAAIAALALLAGCSENDEMGTQKQASVPAVTNEAKDAAPAALASSPPAVQPPAAVQPPPVPAPAPPTAAAPPPPSTPIPPPPPATDPAGNVAPPAPADAAATNAPPGTTPPNIDSGDKK